jgi:hypothetical protein
MREEDIFRIWDLCVVVVVWIRRKLSGLSFTSGRSKPLRRNVKNENC